MIASRSEILPSAPLLASSAAIEVVVPSDTSVAVSTTSVFVLAVTLVANSDVSLVVRSVAVAVTISPALTAAVKRLEIVALPEPSVVTVAKPR